jgi:hypothetical protein
MKTPHPSSRSDNRKHLFTLPLRASVLWMPGHQAESLPQQIPHPHPTEFPGPMWLSHLCTGHRTTAAGLRAASSSRFADAGQGLAGLLPLRVLVHGGLHAILSASPSHHAVLRGPADKTRNQSVLPLHAGRQGGKRQISGPEPQI